MKQHIHILGICGTFMGGVALLARDLGFEVSGSDANVYPPMSTQLEAAGIEPSPPADRYTLIRRLSYDLLGLPPSPEDVDAFVDRVLVGGRAVVERLDVLQDQHARGPVLGVFGLLRDPLF